MNTAVLLPPQTKIHRPVATHPTWIIQPAQSPSSSPTTTPVSHKPYARLLILLFIMTVCMGGLRKHISTVSALRTGTNLDSSLKANYHWEGYRRVPW